MRAAPIGAVAAALLLAPIAGAGSETMPWPSGEISVQRLLPQQGVPPEVVTTLYQDRDGFIWIGSRSGLALYDGYTFNLFASDPADPASLSDNPIRTVYEDSRGNLWVGTNAGGLNRLDRSTWTFTHYRHDSADPASLSHDSVYAVLEDRQGRLWVGTQQGLNLMDRENGTFRRFLEPGSEQAAYVATLLEDRSGRLLVGTVAGGILVLEVGAEEFTRLSVSGPAAERLQQASVFDLEEMEGGELLATMGSGILVIGTDRSAHLVEGIGVQSDLRGEASVTALAPGPGGLVWAATHGAGLVLLDSTDGRMRRLRHDPAEPLSLSHDTVIHVMADRQGTLWAATWGGGVSRIARASLFLAAAPRPPAPSAGVQDRNVTGLCRDREGRLWIGTRSGDLLRWDPSQQRLESFLGEQRRALLTLAEDAHGHIWAGASNELIRLDPATGAHEVHLHEPDDPGSPGPGYIRALMRDRDGRLWVGTGEGGLQQVDESGRVVRAFRHDPRAASSLSDDYVTALMEGRDGTLWVGTRSGGLNALIPGTGAVERFEAAPVGRGRLSHHLVTSLLEGLDGSVWVGTGGGGLNRLDRQEDGSFRIAHVGQEQGLIDDNVMGLLLDDDGSIWASSKLGLSRHDPVSGAFVNYYREDGLPSAEFEPGVAVRLEKGLYFGSVAWVGSAPAGTAFPAVRPSRTVVRDIRMPGGEARRDRPAWRVERLDIPYGQWLALELANLDLTGGSGHAFAYRLGGEESDWVDLGSQRSITFTDLRPGQVMFEARSRNSLGAWSAVEPPLALNVIPPFWMTGWFRGLVLALVVAGALTTHFGRLAVVNRRNRVLEELHEQRERARQDLDVALQRLRVLARSLERAKEDERKHVARELHDDMGPALTAVLINLQLVGREPLSERAARRIRETTDLVDRLVAQIRDLSLDLRPPLLDEMGLISSLRGYMETQSDRTGQRIVVEDAGLPERMSPEVEITGFRIAQEAVTNAIRHAEAGTVTVMVAGRDGDLELTVTDDGRGFDVSGTLESTATGKAMGLLGMQERVRMLGGACDITSSPGAGTRVRVRLPLEPA